MAFPFEPRVPGRIPKLAGQKWPDVAPYLEEFLKRLVDANDGAQTTLLDVAGTSVGADDPSFRPRPPLAHRHHADHVDGLEPRFSPRPPTGHLHDAAQIVGLESPLAPRPPRPHTHQAAEISGLATLGTRSVGLTLDGTSVSTGEKGFVRIPFSGTITRWTVMADAAGSVVFDIWKDTFGAFPPVSGDSIVGGGGNKPTLASAQSDSAAPASWATTAITVGDVLAFNVESTVGLGRVTLQLDVET